MKFPETIDVAGVKYNIKIVSDGKKVDEDYPHHVGNIRFRKQEIRLDTSPSDDMVWVTFIHEISHAIHEAMSVYGKKVEIDEDFVDQQAHLLWQVIKQVLEAQ